LATHRHSHAGAEFRAQQFEDANRKYQSLGRSAPPASSVSQKGA
jgi:hypothetical protein